jgi:hypothetical protein
MKRKAQNSRLIVGLLAVLCVQFCGICVSILCAVFATDGYIGNRMYDAADIFTAVVGYGAGVKVRVGPVQTGVLIDFPQAGLRGGRFSDYRGEKEEFIPANFDFQMLCFGAEGVSLLNDWRNKSYQAGATASGDYGKSFIPFFHRVRSSHELSSRSYYTGVEVVLGVGGSIRIGFNFGELLDFILGWFAVDIYGDDLSGPIGH